MLEKLEALEALENLEALEIIDNLELLDYLEHLVLVFMLPEIEALENALSRLPGLGKRSAERVALALMREPDRLLVPLVMALQRANDEVCCCERCGAFTVRSRQPCDLCTDVLRDSKMLCVVEEPADIVTIEASGAFKGRYHVLGGKLSPVHRTGPDKLRFLELKARLEEEHFEEVLLALSTDMEGDATVGFLADMLQSYSVRVTRLAFGLPADSGVAYSDALTLRRAIVHRNLV